MDFAELRYALVEAMRDVSTFILNEDLKQFSSSLDLHYSSKSLDDQTKEIDSRALRIITDSLKSKLPATKALLVSEENPIGEPLSTIDRLPDLLFIIDLIDNTDGAIHGGVPFSAITVYCRAACKVIAAAIADPALRHIYYADDEIPNAVRYALNDKPGTYNGITLTPNKTHDISGAYISIYTLKPTRLLLVSKAVKLLTALGENGRVECLGGSVSLCRVAAGYIDAAVEFAKGF
jgi:fructose-1,6-bisphosphatase/inositol monophosphatase family enzyme